ELGCVVGRPEPPQATDIATNAVTVMILTCPSMLITVWVTRYAVVASRTRTERFAGDRETSPRAVAQHAVRPWLFGGRAEIPRPRNWDEAHLHARVRFEV